jgi:hypothetical protein
MVSSKSSSEYNHQSTSTEYNWPFNLRFVVKALGKQFKPVNWLVLAWLATGVKIIRDQNNDSRALLLNIVVLSL